MAARSRQYPIHPTDLGRLRGTVSVHEGRDRCDGSPVFRVGYVSGGGDIQFTSTPVVLQDHAEAAARILGQLVNAKEIKLAP